MKLPAAVVLVLALWVAATAHANTVSPICKVNNSTTVDCTTWHSGDVTLRWTWDPFGSETGTSGCSTETFSSDTPASGADRKCTVSWGPVDVSYTATVKVDQTKPVVTSATPLRPPDFGGWFNHAVPVGFAGADALSGIASCDTVTYAGPDGAGAAVSGGCRDVAGNRAVSSFPLAYDSTPPGPAQVNAEPENGSVRLTWVPPADAASVVVVRQTQAAATKTLYRGSGHNVTDRGLRNGVRYRYTVTVLDQAGNANTSTASAVPTSSPLRPVSGTAVSAPPRLTWKSVKGATYYNVQIFKGRKKVLSAWPHGNHLQLRAKWRYRGHRLRLKTGTYRWYVWPGLGGRAAERYGRLLGRSSFHVSS
jgi:hypothetical protein